MNKYISKFKKYTNEDFSHKTIPEEIKELVLIIRNNIENNIYDKKYEIGDGVFIDLKLNFNRNTKPYYSNINIFDIINGAKNIPLIIQLEKDFDLNYLIGIITHEIRHIYDIFTISSDVEIEDFKKSLYLNFKNNTFLDLVYLSLEHELIAYNNMLYGSYRWLNITDKNELFNLIKKSYTYKSLIRLHDFNYKNFIINFDGDINLFLSEFSNKFNDDFDGDAEKYLEKWELFFKQKSTFYFKQIDIIIKDIIDDIDKDNINEYLENRYDLGTTSFKDSIALNIFLGLIIEKNKLYGILP